MGDMSAEDERRELIRGVLDGYLDELPVGEDPDTDDLADNIMLALARWEQRCD